MVVSHSLLTWRSTIGPITIDGKHPPFLVWKYKIKGDYLLSVTKVQMTWLAALCSVCVEHQDKWILVVENLGVNWVCVCLLLFRAGDCACRGCFLTSRWSIRIFVFVTLFPCYLLPNLAFGKRRLSFFNFFLYTLYLHMYLHYIYFLHDAYTTLTCTTCNTCVTIQLHQSNWITVDLFTLLFAC